MAYPPLIVTSQTIVPCFDGTARKDGLVTWQKLGLADPPVGATSVLFTRLLDNRAVKVVFQPIVRIESGEIVTFEALARGPQRTVLASPAALFAEANRIGRVAELDWACRAAALKTFMSAQLPNSVVLFNNVEPSSVGSSCPPDLAGIFADTDYRKRHVVRELTERSIVDDPAGLLRAVEDARRQSVGIALDDVGVAPASLAIMPLIRPDVIKLDLSLIQEQTTPAVAGVANAVLAEAERTGAVILAEGIETEQHVAMARSFGAGLGQGWRYGRPGQLPMRLPPPAHPIELLGAIPNDVNTPFEAAKGRGLNRAPERYLQPMTMNLEHRVRFPGESSVLLACFPSRQRFREATQYRYTQLASRAAFTAVVGRDISVDPAPGIRGARLADGDPIGDEWCVLVLGPHFAGALLAKLAVDGQTADERIFDFMITFDRDVVIAAARPLLKRVLAANTEDSSE